MTDYREQIERKLERAKKMGWPVELPTATVETLLAENERLKADIALLVARC